MKAVDLKKLVSQALPWPADLEARTDYSRLHDDHDGEHRGTLHVIISDDGDAHVSIDFGHPLRFRNFGGGGCSIRTRNALVILALAMKLDSESGAYNMPAEQKGGE